jgi:hypothetical protein
MAVAAGRIDRLCGSVINSLMDSDFHVLKQGNAAWTGKRTKANKHAGRAGVRRGGALLDACII